MNPHSDTETQAPRVVRLDEHTIDALAERVAALIGPSAPTPTPVGAPSGEARGRSPGALLSAAEVAAQFNVDRDWVYAHADQLGALRLAPVPSHGCASTPTASPPTSTPPPYRRGDIGEPSRRFERMPIFDLAYWAK